MWKKLLKDYFYFSKKERTAVIVLVICIAVLLMLPRLIPEEKILVDRITLEEINTLPATVPPDAGSRWPVTGFHSRSPAYRPARAYDVAPVAGPLFYFDPNTLPETGWKKLGLPDKTIHTIGNYIARGGVFRQASDLGKIYGLREQLLTRLLPYVLIARPAASLQATAMHQQTFTRASAYTPSAALTAIDINTADTSAFIRLPGIGSRLAARIVRFREKLGGFYSTGQVAEIYGLPDSVFMRIRPWLTVTATVMRSIHINTVTADELKEHPYFRWAVANAIVAYRRQHGNFTDVESLMQVALVTPDLYQKLAPYITLQ